MVYFDPLKKWFSQVRFRAISHDLGYAPEEFDTKTGMLWKMSGSLIFCVDFYWTNMHLSHKYTSKNQTWEIISPLSC